MKKFSLFLFIFFLFFSPRNFAFIDRSDDSSLIGTWQMTDFVLDEASMEVMSYLDAQQNIAFRARINKFIQQTSYNFKADGSLTLTKINKEGEKAIQSSGTWKISQENGDKILIITEKDGNVKKAKILKLEITKLVLQPILKGSIKGDMVFKST